MPRAQPSLHMLMQSGLFHTKLKRGRQSGSTEKGHKRAPLRGAPFLRTRCAIDLSSFSLLDSFDEATTHSPLGSIYLCAFFASVQLGGGGVSLLDTKLGSTENERHEEVSRVKVRGLLQELVDCTVLLRIIPCPILC